MINIYSNEELDKIDNLLCQVRLEANKWIESNKMSYIKELVQQIKTAKTDIEIENILENLCKPIMFDIPVKRT